jgi:TolB-like protein
MAILLGGLLHARTASETRRSLEPRRVIVVPLANDTGDDELAPLGRMAADWITEGITRVGGFEVVPASAVLAVEREAGAGAGARELALETGAGLLVTGAFYRGAGELLFQARIVESATGRLVHAVEPVASPADSAVAGIDRLRTRVLAALAPMADTVTHARGALPPPTFEAYREYIDGLATFVHGDPATALRHFERAADADLGYPMPRIAAAIMHMNLGDFVAADSLAHAVQGERDRLGPLERSTLDMVLAFLRGDQAAAYDASVRQARIAPGSIGEYMVGEMARKLNRPGEAVAVLTAMGAERGELRGWRAYWRELTGSHHMLGQHRRELRTARQARSHHPTDPVVLGYEVRALAALGRVRDLDARIQERLADPGGGQPTAGDLMGMAADELAAHGRPEPARRLAERAVAWYESQPESVRRTAAHRHDHASALRRVGRLIEARTIVAALAEEDPDDLQAVAHLGTLAARAGDRDQAQRVAARLAARPPRPGLTGPIDDSWGAHTYARAVIAAWLGDTDLALVLLRQAHAEGLQFSPTLHADPDLDPLREDPRFQEWIRPRR